MKISRFKPELIRVQRKDPYALPTWRANLIALLMVMAFGWFFGILMGYYLGGLG